MVDLLAYSAGTRILSRITDDLYDFIKDKTSKSIQKKNIERKVPDLLNKICNVRNVKTLWQLDQAVDVETFYCDTHLIFPTKKRGGKGARKKVDAVSDLNTTHNIVIKGIAGQGKSIFLRHLCAREFETGIRIPVFIELRRIQANETVLEHINRFLDILDLPIDEDLFKILSKSGKFIFFFDGFDEIPDDLRLSIINELEYLSSCATNSQFIVSTRPNSPIEMSPYFDVYLLDNLQGNEYKRVIEKLADSPEYSSNLIGVIESHKAKLSELLCNPLLVTLLLITYKSYQKLPEQLSDFYESIFFVLLQRHDGTKPGFMRPRRCSINDSQYRGIFDAFCFRSKRERGAAFDYQTVYKLIKDAMDLASVEEDPDRYLKDIKQVTCLLLEEGNEYRFIHKSVQEYYSSSFLKNRPDTNAISFYAACLDYKTYSAWNSELRFLAEIDKYRYNKYYLVPLCRRWLDVESDDDLLKGSPPLTTERTKALIGSFGLMLKQDKKKGISGLMTGTTRQMISDESLFNLKLVPTFFEEIDYTNLLMQLMSKKIIVNNELLERYSIHRSYTPSPSKGLKQYVITVHQVIDEGFFLDTFKSLAQRVSEYVYKLWKNAHSYVEKEDSLDITY